MENFKRYIRERGNGAPVEPREVNVLLYAHPWFATARLVQRGVKVPLPQKTEFGGRNSEVGKESCEIKVEPTPELQPPTSDLRKEASEEEQIIDQFLSVGEHRITPQESTPEGDIAAEEEPLVEGMVSETLAQIYMQQELWEQAREAYEKLRLAFPEKNAYFAAIIAGIAAQEEAEKE